MFQAPLEINQQRVPLLILSDPAYPLLPWLIKTYTGVNLSAEKESFNAYHSSIRIAVEIAFGRLKARWRIMGKRLDTNISFSKTIIATCCCLHNYCEKEGEALPRRTQHQDEVRNIPHVRPYNQDDEFGEGSRCREAICNYLLENVPLRQSSLRR